MLELERLRSLSPRPSFRRGLRGGGGEADREVTRARTQCQLQNRNPGLLAPAGGRHGNGTEMKQERSSRDLETVSC